MDVLNSYKCGGPWRECNCTDDRVHYDRLGRAQTLDIAADDDILYRHDDPELAIIVAAIVASEREEAEEQERLGRYEEDRHCRDMMTDSSQTLRTRLHQSGTQIS